MNHARGGYLFGFVSEQQRVLKGFKAKKHVGISYFAGSMNDTLRGMALVGHWQGESTGSWCGPADQMKIPGAA